MTFTKRKNTALERLCSGFVSFSLLFGALIALPGAWPARATEVGSSERATLQQVEASLDGIKSFSELVRTKKNTERYYQALLAYYGELDHDMFLKVLAQVNELEKKVPGIKARLWEPSPAGFEPYEIQTTMKSYGRDLKKTAWEKYMSAWRKGLEEEAAPILKLKDKQMREAKVEKIMAASKQRLATGIAEIESSGRGKGAMGQMRNALFTAELARPDNQQAAAYLIVRFLRDSEASSPLRSGNPDQILDAVGRFKQNPRLILKDLPFDAESATGLIKARLPEQSALLERKDMFTVRMIETRNGQAPEGVTPARSFKFVPSPRRLHGIFKGVWAGECIGGSSSYPNDLHAERWSSILLDQSAIYFIERSGKFEGWVTAIGIERIQGGEKYVATQISWNASSNSVPVFDDSIQAYTSLQMGDLWLRAALQHLPPGFKGLTDATGTTSEAYVAASGNTKFFRVIDQKLGIEIPKANVHSRNGHMHGSYEGRMVFGTFDKGNEEMSLYSPEDRVETLGPAEIRAALLGSDPLRIRSALRTLVAESDYSLLEELLAEAPLANHAWLKPALVEFPETSYFLLSEDGEFALPREKLLSIAHEAIFELIARPGGVNPKLIEVVQSMTSNGIQDGTTQVLLARLLTTVSEPSTNYNYSNSGPELAQSLASSVEEIGLDPEAKRILQEGARDLPSRAKAIMDWRFQRTSEEYFKNIQTHLLAALRESKNCKAQLKPAR